MKTLILDNFDSFTYNLYQYIAELGGNPVVHRNNEITLGEIARGNYSHIIISPGPGSPDKKKDFGICGDVIKKFKGKIPILGVCLGHQGIIHYLGGRVIRAPVPMHGKRSLIRINNSHALFRGLPQEIEVMRYHSLIGESPSIPAELEVIGETHNKLNMAVAHKTLPLYGVQFHPESVGTPLGKEILKNFLSLPLRPLHDDMKKFIDDIVTGRLPEDKIAKTLKEMAASGETVEEIVGVARGMRKYAVPLPLPKKFIVTDLCGTGGSGLPRMNISTTASFVLAAAGVKIAKHGNRAASGRCGSFDVLEKLGIHIELSPERVAEAIQKIGIGFLFTRLFHPAMKAVAPIRSKLGIRTVFNFAGPLTNPARPAYHLLGTTGAENAEKMALAMKNLGYKHAMVVAGEDGLDDVTLTGKTIVFDLRRGKITQREFSPEELGIPRVKDFKKISGGTPEENAKFFIKLLQGKAPKDLQNLLLINCAFGFLVAEKVRNLKEGLRLAKKTIASGAAFKKFQEYKEFSLAAAKAACRIIGSEAAAKCSFRAAIRGKEKISVIAEIKRYSPSYGKPFPKHSVKELVDAYEKGGASALSVVTAPVPFKGGLDLLREARKLTKLPIIRKDFITETRHIDESIEAGADAILLIARKLASNKLKTLVKYALKKNIDSVVEIYFDEDLKKIRGLAGIIIGINNRNLENFSTDVNHATKLIKKINPHFTIIAESAFKSQKDFIPYKGKIDAVLIGTALLKTKNPQEALESFAH